MSTFKYNSVCSSFATGAFNWLTCAPKVILVDAGYVPDPAHNFVNQIPAGSIAVRSAALTSVAQTNGKCTALVPQINALLWPNPIVGVIIYNDTGSDATSRLIYYSSDGFGFPFTAVGFNYAVAYDQAGGGWFQV